MTYTVPNLPSSPPNTYTISVSLTSGISGLISTVTALIVPSSTSSVAIITLPTSNTWTAGAQQSFTLSDLQSNGQPWPTPDTNAFTLSISNSTNGASITPTFVAQTGTSPSFTCSVTPLVTGLYRLQILLSGVVATQQTKNSVYSVRVVAGAVSAAKSSVVGFPATITAGTQGTFTVQLRDAYSNAIDVGGRVISITSNTQDVALVGACTEGANLVYTCRFTSNVASGATNKLITVLESSSTGSIGAKTYELTVLPDILAPAFCSATAFLPAAPGNRAGATMAFSIVARDKYSNAVTNSSLTSAFNVTIFKGDTNLNIPVSIAYQSNVLTYGASFYNTKSGTLTVNVYAFGVPITGSPFSLPIDSAIANEAGTTVSSPGTVASGNPITFTITAKDTYLNDYNLPASKWSVTYASPVAVDENAIVINPSCT